MTGLTKALAKNLNAKTLTCCFHLYSSTIVEKGLFFDNDDDAACQIFKADETEFSTDPNGRKNYYF